MSWINKYKIFVVGSDVNYANWIPGEIVTNIADADLVLFTGGEDVDPSMYGESTNPRTYSNLRRDEKEKKIFDEAFRLGKYCLGICRGSQFLCVMSGGKLVQHQENPLYIHNISTYDDKIIPISSTHHQAQFPYNLPKNKFKMIAWTKGISKMHQDGDTDEMHLPLNKEAEIVFYKDTKCLGIQGHPEMIYKDLKYKETISYLQTMLMKFMNNIYHDQMTDTFMKIL